MASVIPKEVKLEIVTRWLAATEPTWKVALFTTNQCLSQSLYSSCTGQVSSSGTGYTTGGATLADRAVGYDGTGLNAYIDATNTAWTTATFTANYAVVYETSGSKIRAVFDFGGAKTVTNGTFTIIWNASGLIKISS